MNSQHHPKGITTFSNLRSGALKRMKATAPKNQEIKVSEQSSLTVSGILVVGMINLWGKRKLWVALSVMASH